MNVILLPGHIEKTTSHMKCDATQTRSYTNITLSSDVLDLWRRNLLAPCNSIALGCPTLKTIFSTQ
jgi:hypothetical protein